MEPVYFDQLFKRNNRGNYIQRDEPLPTNWRHHDRIIALWIKNNPVKINFDDPNLKHGEWARMAFEGSWSWGSQESRTYPIYPRYGLLI